MNWAGFSDGGDKELPWSGYLTTAEGRFRTIEWWHQIVSGLATVVTRNVLFQLYVRSEYAVSVM